MIKQSELTSIKESLIKKESDLIGQLPGDELEYGYKFPPAPLGWSFNRTSFGSASGLKVVVFCTFSGKVNNVPVYYDGWEKTVYCEEEVVPLALERP